MKRVFTLKNEESDKFWAIETNGENLAVNFGKVKNTTMALSSWDKREQQHPKDPVALRLGEGGSVSEKSFASAELCGKEAEKLIVKKIKEGYIEQETLFIDLDEGMQMFQDRTLDNFLMNRHKVGEPAPDPLDLGLPEKAALLRKALAELDKREILEITYDVHLFIQYISIALEYKHLMNRHLIFDDMAQFFYRLPKFKAANEDIAEGIKVLYASGLHMGKRDGIAGLADFCAKHLDEGNTEEKKLIEVAAQERPIFYRIYVGLLAQKQNARAEAEKNRIAALRQEAGRTKRCFTFQDEKADKFWLIETKDKTLFTLSGNNDISEEDSLCSKGKESEAVFDTAEACEKEVEKLIAKKIKAGFIEQDDFFISFFNEVRGLYNLNRPSKLNELLAELDKRDTPFVISYGSDHLLHSLEIIFTAQVKAAKVLSGVTTFIYHLPKLEGADEQAKNNLLSIYGVGLRCAAVCNDEKLDAFCRAQLPVKSDDPYIAAGFAYSAARWNHPDEVKENLKRAFFTYYAESERYEKLEFFKPYTDIIVACKKEAPGS